MNTASLPIKVPDKIPVDSRVWMGTQRALANLLKHADIIACRAEDIVQACKHAPGCPGEKDAEELCLLTCPDRETRLNALTIRAFAREDHVGDLPAPAAKGMYMPPTREFFDQIVAECGSLREQVQGPKIRWHYIVASAIGAASLAGTAPHMPIAVAITTGAIVGALFAIAPRLRRKKGSASS